MNSNLFRKEALGSQDEEFGVVTIPIPLKYRIYVALLVSFALSLILIILYGEYSSIKTASGTVDSKDGVSELFSNRRGIVVKVYVNEGDIVKAGDPLISIDTSRHGRGLNVDKELSSILINRNNIINKKIEKNEELKRLKQDVYQSDLKIIKEEIELTKSMIESQIIELEIDNSELNSYQTLFGKDQISSTTLNEAKSKLRDSKNKLVTHRNRLSVLNVNLEKIHHVHLNDIVEIEKTILNLHEENNRIEQQLLEARANENHLITSPIDGHVSLLLSKVGNFVDYDHHLISVLPKNTFLQANLYVPSRDIGLISVGNKVNLKFDAYPFEKFGIHSGVISKISNTVIIPEYFDEPVTLLEPSYRVEVSLDKQYVTAFGNRANLQPGMKLTGHIVTRKQSLLEWIYEPLLSLQGGSIGW